MLVVQCFMGSGTVSGSPERTTPIPLQAVQFEPELRSRARPHVSVLAVFGWGAPDKLDSATPS